MSESSALGKAASRILPQARLGGPMPWVIAIMITLTVIAVGAGLALANLAANARAEISGGITVQVVEAVPATRDRETGAASYPQPVGVIEVLEKRGFAADVSAMKLKGNIHFEEYW